MSRQNQFHSRRQAARTGPQLAAHASRRGVILLVVMSLLALFTLIAITLVLATSQARTSSLAGARANRTGTPYEDHLKQASRQVFRGHSDNISSVIGPHSLGEDIFGDRAEVNQIPSTAAGDPIDGFLPNTAGYVVGQGAMMFIDVLVYGRDQQPGVAGFDDDGNGTVDDASEVDWLNSDDMSDVNGYYNGRLITMLNGPARLRTARITGYDMLPGAPPTARLRLQPFFGMSTNAAGTAWQTAGAPTVGNRFLINGRPFSGSGFGFEAATFATWGLLGYDGGDGPGAGGVDDDGNLAIDDETELGWPGTNDVSPALTPNIRNFSQDPANLANWANYLAAAPGFEANEDYDAPDSQNMMLAAEVWNGTLGRWEVPLPSLHRPDLMLFWNNRVPGSMSNPVVRRQVMLRPDPADHRFTDTNGNNAWDTGEPWGDTNGNGVYDVGIDSFLDLNGNTTFDAGEPDFTGKPFNPFMGPWDVDNDGDGQADSVWVDIGLEVQTAPDGRKYKPLVAILCLDQDGKLNMNAHGSWAHWRQITPIPGTAPFEEYVTATNISNLTTGATPIAGPYAGNSQVIMVPMGGGFGPADVNLGAVLPAPYFNSLATNSTANEYRWLLEGRGSVVGLPAVPGRYGEDYIHYGAAGSPPYARPGWTSTGTPMHAGPDNTPGTYDDAYSGDDNRPLSPYATLLGPDWPNPTLEYLLGNLYHDGYFPQLPTGVNGSPANLLGGGTLGVDLRGQPYWWNYGYAGTPAFPAAGAVQETVDDPYELDLVHGARARADYGPDAIPGTSDDPGAAGAGRRLNIDEPFTPSELEALLRYRDTDAAALPSRLRSLAPSLFDPTIDPANHEINRRLLTAGGFDLPVPSVVPTRDMVVGPDTFPGTGDDLIQTLNKPPSSLHITDLLRYRVLTDPQGAINAATAGWLNGQIAVMLPPDLLAGLRMDINRPLGNGADDNGNGVIDEPIEAIAESLWRTAGADGSFFTADDVFGPAFDADANGLIDQNDMLARHIFARHLYVLLMILKDSGYAPNLVEFPGNPGPEETELTSQRLAQWAINVVDFRDRDAIMTPFEYDANPFNGWDVDGWVTVLPGPDGVFGTGDETTSPNESHADRRVVWGCEYPELVLTETINIHDRRAEDLTMPSGKSNPMPETDPVNDFDQRRIPQGSSFVELYCTRNPNNPSHQGDLYTPTGLLDLGRMDNGDTGDYPVWRLAVSQGRLQSGNNNVAQRLQDNPDSVSLDPDHMNVFDANSGLLGGTPNVTIDRIVWMAPQQPAAGVIDRNLIYYNYAANGTPTLLTPGQYAVVGPHRNPQGGMENITTIGFTTAAPYAQEIRLGDQPATTGAGGLRPVTVSDNTGNNNNYPNDPNTTGTPGTYEIQEPLGIAVAGEIPASVWPTPAAGLSRAAGFSISEPLFSSLNYYPMPDNTATTSVTQFDGATTTHIDTYLTPLDQPFDSDNTNPGALAHPNNLGSVATGTYRNYRTLFLQRLADPTLPWNPPVGQPGNQAGLAINPYITVDWMPMDLTVFNGEYNRPANEQDPEDPNPDAVGTPTEVRFATRQRGTRRTFTPGTNDYNIWKQPRWGTGVNAPSAATEEPNTDPIRGGGAGSYGNAAPGVSFGSYFNLDNTLGYLNLAFQNTGAAPAWWTTANLPAGYAPTVYVGDPLRPFPWLAWNNRPFASQMELMLVPTSSPARLLHEFDVRRTSFENDHLDPNPNSTGAPYTSNNLPYTTGTPFGHLLNFFNSSYAFDSGAGPSAPEGNHHRLMDLVHVPSRFSGAEELLNPVLFQAGVGTLNAAPFYAPFNRISRYRDPGRINLNTVFDDGRTLEGILNEMQDAEFMDGGGTIQQTDDTWHSGGLDLWNKFTRSRHGYDPTLFASTGGFNPASPSMFANPFRSFGQGFAVPVAAMHHENIDPMQPVRRLADGTLLRVDPDISTNPRYSVPAGLYRPLFVNQVQNGLVGTGTGPSELDYPPQSDYANTDRNAYFRYQALQKLGNVATTRSNVYAVWITLGYFEVERQAVDAVHPDGWRLVRELDSDTGEVKRHRAFYIFDRSIPMGFIRGQNLNVEDGILVERIIE